MAAASCDDRPKSTRSLRLLIRSLCARWRAMHEPPAAAPADLAAQWAHLVTTAGTAVKRAPDNVARYASASAVRLQLEALGPEAAAEIVRSGQATTTRALVEVALNCPLLWPKADEIQHTLARAALSAVKKWCQ